MIVSYTFNITYSFDIALLMTNRSRDLNNVLRCLSFLDIELIASKTIRMREKNIIVDWDSL